MDDWVERAMARMPNVPALFGWLGLNRRGEWLIQGEVIRHRRIVDTIARNYGVDEHGRWFFQNGPQRGYITLEYAPLIARVQTDDRLVTHTGQPIDKARALYLDEDSNAVLDSDAGAVLIQGADLAWVLEHLRADGSDAEVEEAALAEAMEAAPGSRTGLELVFAGERLPVHRCDRADMGETLGFVAEPAPREGENSN